MRQFDSILAWKYTILNQCSSKKGTTHLAPKMPKKIIIFLTSTRTFLVHVLTFRTFSLKKSRKVIKSARKCNFFSRKYCEKVCEKCANYPRKSCRKPKIIAEILITSLFFQQKCAILHKIVNLLATFHHFLNIILQSASAHFFIIIITFPKSTASLRVEVTNFTPKLGWGS